MASRSSAIVQLLLGNVQGVSTVSANVSVPPLPPGGPFPYLVIQELMPKNLENLVGSSGNIRSIIQVSSWSKDYEEAAALRDTARDALIAFSGDAGDWTIDGVNHNVDSELYDDKQELHQLITRVFIWWIPNV